MAYRHMLCKYFSQYRKILSIGVINVTFGQRLRILRKEQKLRQEDLATIIRVHRATIGKYETNERFPDQATLQRFADYFETSIDYLLNRTDIRKPYETVKEREDKYNPDSIYHLEIKGLPEEAIERIEEYIEFIKMKYGLIDSEH